MAQKTLLAVAFVLCISAADGFAAVPQIVRAAHARAAARTSVGLRSSHSSTPASATWTRRDAVGRALSLLGGAAVAGTLPQTAAAKLTKATAEDTVKAWNKLVDAQDLLADVGPLVAAKDWPGIVEFLNQDEFAKIEENLLILINGPVLNTDDKKVIGTRKRYGVAADVIYGVGGVKGAISNIENPQIKSCSAGICSGDFVSVDAEVPKSLSSLKNSLSEVLQICKSYKAFVRSK